MAFKGWPVAAVEFYEGLEADNTKGYWDEHRSVYDAAVKAPMEALLAELADRFGPGRTFRPFRDVRFSRDKSPYKTNCAAHLDGGGYLSFSADGLMAGSGLFMPEPATLERYRAAVDEERSGAELASVVATLRNQGYDVGAHEVLKTAPRGYPKDHPRIELLRYKGIVMSKSWPVGAWLGTPKAKERVVACLEAAVPLRDWLDRFVS